MGFRRSQPRAYQAHWRLLPDAVRLLRRLFETHTQAALIGPYRDTQVPQWRHATALASFARVAASARTSHKREVPKWPKHGHATWLVP